MNISVSLSAPLLTGVCLGVAITEAGAPTQQGAVAPTAHQAGRWKAAVFVAACLCSCMAAWHVVEQKRLFSPSKSGWQVKTFQRWVINYRVDATWLCVCVCVSSDLLSMAINILNVNAALCDVNLVSDVERWTRIRRGLGFLLLSRFINAHVTGKRILECREGVRGGRGEFSCCMSFLK